MSHPLKVPGMALATAFLLVACGGDAESADDQMSERLEPVVEMEETGLQEPGEGAVPALEAPVRDRPAESPPRPPASTDVSDHAAAPPPPEVEPEPEVVVEPDGVEPAPVAIPAGATISAVLQTSLSTRSHRSGDPFDARVFEEVLASDGMVLVPEGARLEGRVLEARPSEGADEEAVLVLSVERLVMNGRSFPLRSTVVETRMEASARDSGTRSAAKVATGAAAGAVLGQILGRDTRSTVTGAAAGAAAGAGVAIATRDGHAQIAEGSVLVLRLDEAVILASGS